MIKNDINQVLKNIRIELKTLYNDDKNTFMNVCAELLGLDTLDKYDVQYIKYHSPYIALMVRHFYYLMLEGKIDSILFGIHYVISQDALLYLLESNTHKVLEQFHVDLTKLPTNTRKKYIETKYDTYQKKWNGTLWSLKYKRAVKKLEILKDN